MSNIALITGATKGIGLAISQLLHDSGYQVIGIARNDIGDKFPGKLYTCNLDNTQETEKILLEIQQSHPNISHIVNNVGVTLPQPLGSIDLKSLDTVFNVNVKTAIQVTQTFVEHMKSTRYGKIINITSRAIYGVKDRSSYAAAKSALVGLTRTWALELAPYGINVNAVSPGPTETDLFRKTRPIGSQEEQDALKLIPLKRFAQPQEIAETVKFLLSDNASFITGQNIGVDGGSSLNAPF